MNTKAFKLVFQGPVSRLFKNVLPFMCSLINLIILKDVQKKFAIYMCPLKAHEIQCDPSFKSPRSKSPNLGLEHVVLISPSERHIKRATNSPPQTKKEL
jgi:hypothetical protein